MTLKTYSLRLDEEEYEKLRKALSEYGDPDLNIGYILRSYIRDLNKALPNLKKSDLGIRNNLAFFGSLLRHINRIAVIENILKGTPIVERIKSEAKKSES
jgi:hypothetical protein